MSKVSEDDSVVTGSASVTVTGLSFIDDAPVSLLGSSGDPAAVDVSKAASVLPLSVATSLFAAVAAI